MTVYELQHRFNLEVEKYGVKDPVMSTIVEDYMNYAYRKYVDEKYDSLINPLEKFEVTERISRILAPIMDDFTETATFNDMPEYTVGSDVTGWNIDAPSDLLYIVREYVILNITDCNGTAVELKCNVVPIKHSQVNANRNNPFVKPEGNEVWRLNSYGNTIEIIAYDDVTMHTYYCRYIKKLTAVNFNTSVTLGVHDSVHEEIALMAAHLYLGDLRNQNSKKDVA